MSLLVEDWVSRASALQRKGRAGRVRAGVCWGLYTRHRYEQRLRRYQVISAPCAVPAYVSMELMLAHVVTEQWNPYIHTHQTKLPKLLFCVVKERLLIIGCRTVVCLLRLSSVHSMPSMQCMCSNESPSAKSRCLETCTGGRGC